MPTAESSPSASRKNDFRSGDLLAFSGRGCLSRWIQIGTCSKWSHVGGIAWTPKRQLQNLRRSGVLDVPEARLADWRDCYLLYEATTLVNLPCRITGRPIRGVQAHQPAERLAGYDGRAWRLRLDPDWRLSAEESTRLTAYLVSKIGRRYDERGALLSGTRLLKRHWWWGRADLATLFCSELWAGALERIGRLPIENPSTFSPAELIRAMVFHGVYQEPEQVK
ncbi:MAG: hypothetical protein ACYC35_05050 [Pirellulales bacterium]